MYIGETMILLLAIFLVNICTAAELKCPTCFRSEDGECQLVEEVSCSEHTVKAISDFCPGFDDRAMWGLPFICLNIYDQNLGYKRFQGCFHRFNDHLDMCSVLKKACPHDFSCITTNGTLDTQSSDRQKQGQGDGNRREDSSIFDRYVRPKRNVVIMSEPQSTNDQKSTIENNSTGSKLGESYPKNTGTVRPATKSRSSYYLPPVNTSFFPNTFSPWQNIVNFIYNISNSNVTINNHH